MEHPHGHVPWSDDHGEHVLPAVAGVRDADPVRLTWTSAARRARTPYRSYARLLHEA